MTVCNVRALQERHNFGLLGSGRARGRYGVARVRLNGIGRDARMGSVAYRMGPNVAEALEIA